MLESPSVTSSCNVRTVSMCSNSWIFSGDRAVAITRSPRAIADLTSSCPNPEEVPDRIISGLTQRDFESEYTRDEPDELLCTTLAHTGERITVRLREHCARSCGSPCGRSCAFVPNKAPGGCFGAKGVIVILPMSPWDSAASNLSKIQSNAPLIRICTIV